VLTNTYMCLETLQKSHDASAMSQRKQETWPLRIGGSMNSLQTALLKPSLLFFSSLAPCSCVMHLCPFRQRQHAQVRDRQNRKKHYHMLPLIARQGGRPGGEAPDWPGYEAMPGCFVSGCQAAPSKAYCCCSWHLLGWPCGESWCLLDYPILCCPICN
jgi:hypothetical protein